MKQAGKLAESLHRNNQKLTIPPESSGETPDQYINKETVPPRLKGELKDHKMKNH